MNTKTGHPIGYTSATLAALDVALAAESLAALIRLHPEVRDDPKVAALLAQREHHRQLLNRVVTPT